MFFGRNREADAPEPVEQETEAETEPEIEIEPMVSTDSLDEQSATDSPQIEEAELEPDPVPAAQPVTSSESSYLDDEVEHEIETSEVQGSEVEVSATASAEVLPEDASDVDVEAENAPAEVVPPDDELLDSASEGTPEVEIEAEVRAPSDASVAVLAEEPRPNEDHAGDASGELSLEGESVEVLEVDVSDASDGLSLEGESVEVLEEEPSLSVDDAVDDASGELSLEGEFGEIDEVNALDASADAKEPLFVVGGAINLIDAVADETDEALDSMDPDEPWMGSDEPSIGMVDSSTEIAETTPSVELDIPVLPTLDDLRAMAADLDDVDAVLQRLDSNPDEFDFEIDEIGAISEGAPGEDGEEQVLDLDGVSQDLDLAQADAQG